MSTIGKSVGSLNWDACTTCGYYYDVTAKRPPKTRTGEFMLANGQDNGCEKHGRWPEGSQLIFDGNNVICPYHKED